MVVKIRNFAWFRAGAVLGAFLTLVLPIVNKLIVNLFGERQFGITFSVYNIRQQLGAFLGSGNAFGEFLVHLTGVELTVPGMILTVLGTGGLVILSRYIIGAIKWPRKADQKMMAVFALASVLLGFIFASGIREAVGKFSFEFVLFAGLTGYLLTWLIKPLYKQLKWTLPT